MSDTLTCDVCGAPAHFHETNAVVYGRAYGDRGMWVCSDFPRCDSFVGSHPDGKPFGRLKNKKSRELAKECHALFDHLWKNAPSKRKARAIAYCRLARALSISIDDAHFGMMDDEMLVRSIAVMKGWT